VTGALVTGALVGGGLVGSLVGLDGGGVGLTVVGAAVVGLGVLQKLKTRRLASILLRQYSPLKKKATTKQRPSDLRVRRRVRRWHGRSRRIRRWLIRGGTSGNKAALVVRAVPKASWIQDALTLRISTSR